MYSCVPAKERRQRLVEGVGEDLLGPLGRRVRGDDLVERALHVQHHRVQLAARPPATSTRRGLLSSSVRPERLGQPPGRVDGEDDDACGRPRPRAAPAPPPSSSCRRRRSRSRRRSGCPGRRSASSRSSGLGLRRGAVTPADLRAPTGAPRAGRPARTGRRGRSARRSSGSSTVGRPSAVDVVRAARPARPSAAACSTASLGQRVGQRRASVRPAAASAGASSAPVEPALGGPVQVAGRQQRLGGHVDDHRADRQPAPSQLGDRVRGLLHRHLLQQRDQVHRGLRRAQHRHHAVALRLDRAGPGQPAISAVTLRKRVIRPVGGASSTTAS